MSGTMTSLRQHLLVAVPGLQDPQFARTVTLICQHDENGAMGIVINRASDYSLGEIFTQMSLECADAELMAQQALSGGPLHPERGFVLHDGGKTWDSTLDIGDALAITTSRDVLEAMADGNGPAHATVALGCAGWGAGQLEQELVDNAWITVPATPEVLFSLPLEQRWQAAADLIGVDLRRMAEYSGRA